MNRNVCGRHRRLRFVLGAALLLVGYRNRETTAGTLAFVAGSDVTATAIIRRCPVNAVLGVDTCPGS